MRKVMFALAIAVGALMVLQPANAQMTDPVFNLLRSGM